MTTPEAFQLFKEANELWFVDGYTRRALARYQEAARLDPTDPVILVQLARALWAFSRLEEARDLLNAAQRFPQRLSLLGVNILANEVSKLSNPSPFRHALPVAPAELDLELLKTRSLTFQQWMDVAFGAGERGMLGLAAHAFSQVSKMAGIADYEEEWEMEEEADTALHFLNAMRPETEPGAGSSRASGGHEA